MASYTKYLKFSPKAKERIRERDGICIFCKMGYHSEEFDPNSMEFIQHDYAHIIPRSSLGLGIEENGVFCCRYHHHDMDNGIKVRRKEMLDIAKEYLKGIYPDWSEDKLVYKKGYNAKR